LNVENAGMFITALFKGMSNTRNIEWYNYTVISGYHIANKCAITVLRNRVLAQGLIKPILIFFIKDE